MDQYKKKCLIFLFIIAVFLNPEIALACFSITDDFNSPDPVLNVTFNFEPDLEPFRECWSGTLRIRSAKKSWRLVATRRGPVPAVNQGDPSDNIKPSDISIRYEIKGIGQAQADGAILVSPFSSEVDLESIQNGTLIILGVKKSGNSCTIHNPNFYKLTKKLCLFRDFVFNPGQYYGSISYMLVAP
jgi:hypothetical protein